MLEFDELSACIKGVCKDLKMRPPDSGKIYALMQKGDQNHDGVLQLDEWHRVYKMLIKNALVQATASVEAAAAEVETLAAK